MSSYMLIAHQDHKNPMHVYSVIVITHVIALEEGQSGQWTLNLFTGVVGSDVPWLDYPASNAIIWVMTVTE